MNFFSVSLIFVAGLSFAFGLMYLFIGLRRQEERPLNLTLMVSIFVSAGAIDFIFLSDFGFLGFAVAMSLQMANSTCENGLRPSVLIWPSTAGPVRAQPFRKTLESNSKKALTPNGTYLTTKKGIAKERTEDLVFLKELTEAGKIKTAIERRYPLEQAAEDHRYVEKGYKKGNVVITLDHNSKT